MRNVYGSVSSALLGVLLVGLFLFGTAEKANAQCAVLFVNCPTDTIIYPPFPPAVCDALLNVNAPSAAFFPTNPGDCDSYGPITVTQLTGPTSGTFPVGVYTVIFVASATDGITTITDTCQYTITIADTVSPTITGCPSNITLLSMPDSCGNTATWVAPTASDACGIDSFVSTHNSGDFFPVGVTVVTYTATDFSGNTQTCSFTVTVMDTSVPVITFCPGDTVYTLDPADACPFFLQLPEIEIDDNCASGAFITATGATTFAIFGTDASAFYNVGVTTVTVFVDDGSGNTAGCSFTVEIIDNIPPVINCTATDIIVNNDAGLCEANVAVPTVSATDNCSYTITNDYNAQSSVDADLNVVDVFPVGTTIVTFTVTDEGGNTATCSIEVIVNDNEAPTIDCSAAGSPILTDTDPGVCFATISFDVTATDNCGYTISNDFNAQTSTDATLSFTDQFAPGSYTVTFTATDTSGNTATCSVDITVEDNEAPVINCVSFDLPTDPGVCETDSVWSYPSFTDNCDPNPTINHLSGPLPGDVLAPGGYVVEFEVVDASGNSAFCLFFITVVDEEAPVLTCDPGAPTFINLDANCEGVVPDVVTGSSATDNCDDPIDITITQNPTAGTIITGHQTVTIVVTAEDLSGNTSTCGIDIDFNDVTPPVVVCQPTIIVGTSSNGTGDCTGGIVNEPAIEVDENCTFFVDLHVVNESGDTIFASNQGPFSSVGPIVLPVFHSPTPLGTNQFHYLVHDEGGNTASCMQTVIVEDDEDPTITCPGPIAMDTEPDTCGAMVTFTVTATDNCSYTITNDFNGQLSNNADLVFNDFVPGGNTTIVFTVTDTAGNTATCAVDIAINDTQAPNLICPPDIFTNTLNSQVCYDIVTWNPPTPDDNCPGIVIIQQLTNWPNPGLYGANDWKAPYTVVYYAEDANGNTATCSFNITVFDTVRPQIANCPSDTTVFYDPNTCGRTVGWTPPTASDNCVGVVMTANHAPGTFFPVGTTQVVYIAVDSSGNTTSCSFNVTVLDTVAPFFVNCPGDTTVANDLDECGAIVSWPPIIAQDDCAGINQLFAYSGTPVPISDGSGSSFPGPPAVASINVIGLGSSSTLDSVYVNISHTFVGDLVVQLEDPNGGLVTLIDRPGVPASTFGCPEDNIDAHFIPGTGNDAENECASPAPAISGVFTAHTGFDLANLDAIDGTWNLIVTDYAGGDVGNINGVYLRFTSEIEITQIAGLPSGSMFPVGNTTNTFIVEDVTGNTDTCTFVVTVVDTQSPEIICPADILASNDPGQCSANLSIPLPVTSDNCAVLTYSHDSPFGVSSQDASGVYPVGVYTVTYTIEDVSGNTSSCSFTIEVEDTEPPFLVCPSSLTANNAFGMCGNSIQGLNLGFMSDNCGIDTFWNDWTGTQSANAFYPVGVTTVTYYAIDVNGNTGSCSFTVTIIDFEAPTLTCPGNITVSNDTGECHAIVNYTVTVFDNCLGDSLYLTSGLPSGSAFPIGVTTVSYLAVDASGNTSTCSFNVTVEDNEAPVITNCSADITVPNGTGECGAVVFYPTPMVSDNCPGVTISLTSGLASGSFFPVGTTDIVYTATDASGNTAVCEFSVTVLDVEPPTIECLPDMVVSNDSGDCSAVVTFPGLLLSEDFESFSLCSGSATIPCPLTNGWINTTDDDQDWIVFSGSTTSGLTGPSFDHNPGTTSGKYLYIETSGGINFGVAHLVSPSLDLSTATSTTLDFWYHMYGATMGTMHVDVSTDSGVSWINDIVPSWTDDIDLWQNKVVSLDAFNGFPDVRFRIRGIRGSSFTSDMAVDDFKVFSNAIVGQPAFADNCPGATIAQTTGLPSGSSFPVGVTVNTFVVTDASGNTASCSFTVTVEDNEPPVITCPPSVTIPNDPGECYAVHTFADATATDNCGIASLNQTGGLVSGSQFPVGINSVTYAAIDIHGNVSQCTFTVTVEDVEVPIITCPPSITVNNDSALCGADVAILSPTIIENCLFTLTNSYNGTTDASDFYPVGTTTVVFTITDQGLNTATCSFDVTVEDVDLPVITCPADLTLPNDIAFCGALVIFNPPTVSDNCPGVTFIQTAGLPSLSLYPVGTTTNIFTATDASGNTSTCSFDVTILDVEAPDIAFCPGNILVTNDPGICGADVFWPDPHAFDNCIDFSWTSNFNSGDFLPVGTTTVIYIATDSAGNTAQCAFDVTVVDAEAPIFTSCPPNIGSCDPVVTWTQPTVTDNCAVVSITSTDSSGSTFPVGTTTVVYTATDAAGNTATCEFTVTVHPLPMANAGADVAVCSGSGATIGGSPTGSAGTAPYTYSWAPIAGLDDATLANPVASPTATTTYTVTVSDANGCQATDDVTVTVRPLPTVSAGANVAICFGQSTTIGGSPSASGTVGPYLYSWAPAAGLSSTNAANPVASPTVTTIYTLTVTDAFGCQNTATITVTVHPLPNATITPAGPFCLNDPAVTLTAATAGGTWSGNGITNPATGAFSPAAAGVGTHLITYSVTDANGCFNSATTTITIHAVPNSTILPAGPFCTSDQPVFLAGIPNLNPHIWSGTGVNPVTGQFSPGVAGPGNHTITYIVTNANNCTDTATIVITVNASPVVTINPAGPFCETEPVQVLTANVSGGIWSGPGIIQSQLGEFLPIAASAGLHHIVYTYTQTSTGCTARDTTQITVFEVPAISSSVTSASCPDASDGAVDITVTGGTQPYTYQWSNGANTQDLTGVAAGTYNVTVTDANGCAQTAAVTVGISANPVSVTAIITPAWNPSTANGAINITVTGGVPPYTFQWSNGATTEDVDGLLAGTYQLVVVDAAGCSYLFFYNVPSGGVNVDLVDLDKHINLYPNPTSDVLNIDVEVGTIEADMTMTVFDVLGRTVYVSHHNFSGRLSETISTSAWASGQYMIRFIVNGQQLTKKFIVTK